MSMVVATKGKADRREELSCARFTPTVIKTTKSEGNTESSSSPARNAVEGLAFCMAPSQRGGLVVPRVREHRLGAIPGNPASNERGVFATEPGARVSASEMGGPKE